MNRLRNPFNKKPQVANGYPAKQDENLRPVTSDKASEHSSYAASRTSSSLSIKRKEEPPEYKLSVINGDVYLPPSPPEKKSFWPTSPRTNSHRSMLNENEPFSISRESFESYRRSFDISARSPVNHNGTTTPRRSLDQRAIASSNSRINSPRFEKPDPTEEEGFEDVGLDGDTKPPEDPKQLPAKRKSIFARFGDHNSEQPTSADAPRPSSSHRGFHLPGRKRAQSGQSAELGNIDGLTAKDNVDVAVK